MGKKEMFQNTKFHLNLSTDLGVSLCNKQIHKKVSVFLKLIYNNFKYVQERHIKLKKNVFGP